MRESHARCVRLGRSVVGQTKSLAMDVDVP